ncbi:beta-lactamase family protein [Pontibacter sp. E15-1]|uniref:serine hydrolase domain-containing protein n=1 Tax=Pontibacter sp. E15-1 TaxID=2919918 RepID=UPI001F500736|nr:serine hydrolase domain-containing protein [Pontibacter sp. E15-1]MCJ8166177.1 beta-lactamase family protein [Pontibacter sp. E15-1]
MKNLIILLLSLAFSANAQTNSIHKSKPLTEGSPEKVGLSPERLQRIDAMLQEAVADGDIPGAVALVARNGKIVYHKAFGLADNASGQELKRDAIFRIASQTKAITSTAVMMLWEEGRFQLDDPISKYIPEFKNPQVLRTFQYSDTSYTSVPATKEITIRHLLTHTSGLGYGAIDGDERFRMLYRKAGVTDLFTTENISIGESVKRLAALPLHHTPGEKYTYSEGLDVLGYFVEVMSGMPFDVFLRKRLFEPLGMHDTWFYLPQDKAKRLVSVQRREEGEWRRFPVTFYDPDYPVKGARQFFSGGAGLSSTATDYATFLQMYLNGGELNGKRFLSRTTIQAMMGNQIGDLWEGTGRHYGLAFGVQNQKGQDMGGNGSLGTFDWGGYFNTQYFADPKENIIGILMKQTQGTTSDDTGWKFRLLVGQSVDD